MVVHDEEYHLKHFKLWNFSDLVYIQKEKLTEKCELF